MRPRARGGDDDVVAAQVERLDRVRVQRQQRPERARGRAQLLQERGLRVAVGEPALGALLVVDGGEDVGLRPGVADRREHALGAPQVEQEVVNQRNTPHRRAILRTACCAPSLLRPVLALAFPAAAPTPPAPGAAGLARRGRRRPADRARVRRAAAEWDQMAGSGAEAVRAAFYWHQIQPTGRPTRTSPARRARPRRRRSAGSACCRSCTARRPGRALNPGDPALAAARPGGLRAGADRARRALRTERLVMGGASGGRSPADPRVADLERAEPHPLLERRAVGAVLRRSC